jgi:hypothetical protein
MNKRYWLAGVAILGLSAGGALAQTTIETTPADHGVAGPRDRGAAAGHLGTGGEQLQPDQVAAFDRRLRCATETTQTYSTGAIQFGRLSSALR